jgi:hypothetical protein
MKTRECLDKLDRRDITLSTFAMSRNKSLLPFARDLRNIDVAREEDNTVALRLAAEENTRLLQIGAIDETVNDAGLPTVEDDKVALLSLCDMDHTELQIYAKLIEVYDRARSHFLFERLRLRPKPILESYCIPTTRNSF